jgi:integrase/recombinase XerD
MACPDNENGDLSPLIVEPPDDLPTSAQGLFPSGSPGELDRQVTEALEAWLVRTPSRNTRENYSLDLNQFLDFVKIPSDRLGQLAEVRPRQIAAWRDLLQAAGLTNSSIRRKMTALRSFFSYLQTYGYCGANPAHSDFVEAPAVPRDGKTVALSPEDCRRLLDAPDQQTPVGLRDTAILAALAYSACRVGELVSLRVGDYKTTNGHKVLEVYGKGGKERRVPLHSEAVERLERWLEVAGIRDDAAGPLFRQPRSARGQGKDGFKARGLGRRGLQLLVERYVKKLGLDASVTVHSMRVTALTTARERGADVIDLQDFAGHADPRTTLTYIRNRDRLSKSPAYVLKY